MNALERHDLEIEATLLAITKAFNKRHMKVVYDYSKHLTKLLKERRVYTIGKEVAYGKENENKVKNCTTN